MNVHANKSRLIAREYDLFELTRTPSHLCALLLSRILRGGAVSSYCTDLLAVLSIGTLSVLRTFVLMYRFRWAKKVRDVAPDGFLDANQLTILGTLKKRTETRYVVGFFTLCLAVCVTASAIIAIFAGAKKDTWSECNGCGDKRLADGILDFSALGFVVAYIVPVVQMRSDPNDTCQ